MNNSIILYKENNEIENNTYYEECENNEDFFAENFNTT